MALIACEVQRRASSATVRRPVVLHVSLYCIGVGAVIEKCLNRNEIPIAAHVNQIQCFWLGADLGERTVSRNVGDDGK